jgi:hypothetical protein
MFHSACMNAPASARESAPSAAAPLDADAVERPAVVWWVLVLGGLTILAFQAWDAEFYAWWTSHVNWLPGQRFMAWLFIACIPIHVGEAIYVYVAAPRRGLSRSRRAWAIQTLILGYPSTHLFRRRGRLLTSS